MHSPTRAGRVPGPLLATGLLTAVAMLAFAANSLLCRAALREQHIDAASFGAVRLAAGAATLALVRWLQRRPGQRARVLAGGGWRAAALLFAYVACFAFAYLTLPAGTGALILFGAVQLTMFAAGFGAGERFTRGGWLGLLLAVAGLVVLLLPGVAAPSLPGALLMAAAGAAWGGYSILGRGVPDPLAATAGNFVRAAPLGLVLALAFAGRAHADGSGLWLAVVSGAVTSGLGYVVWYAALPRLAALQAASVQLTVPLIAAFGGVLLGEALTPRLLGAAVAILGGIGLVLFTRSTRPS